MNSPENDPPAMEPFHESASGTLPSILIIGIGNTLRGDDAIGPLAAECLRDSLQRWEKLAHVRVLVQFGLTPELAADLAHVHDVLFLDAAQNRESDGALIQPLVPDIASQSALAHHLHPAALLWLTQMLYGAAPQAYLGTVPVSDFKLADRRLTKPARALLEDLLVQVHQWLDHRVTACSQSVQGSCE
jgi:hydrogenase maturation protease